MTSLPRAAYRMAVPGDARALSDLGLRTFLDAFAAQNRREDIEAYVTKAYGETQQREELANPANAVLLALCDETPIGYALVRRGEAPSCVVAGDAIEIGRFYVSSEWHGTGVARELMRRVEELARGPNGVTLWLGVWEHNGRAIAFYERCGFARVGSQPFLLGSDLQTDLVMVKRLPPFGTER